jgi:hypothetical protein
MDMGPAAILLGVAFPILIGIGVALAVADSNEIEFWIARACFAVAAIDALGFTVFWLWSAERFVTWKTAIGAVIGAVTVVALAYGLQWIDYREDKAATKLVAGTKPTPNPPPGCVIPENALAVFLGSSVAWSATFPFTILDMGSINMMSVDKVANKNELIINVLRIYDDHTNIIARIDSDGFWTDPGIRRKKVDKSTLVVYDRADNEVLRAEFINPRTLYIHGIFRDRRGVSVKVTPDEIIFPGNNTLSSACFGNVRVAIRVQ